MKKLLTVVFVTLTCLLVFTACNKKQHAIDNLSDFVEKVEKNAPQYTDAEWKEINKEYDELMAEIDKYEYTEEEAMRIGELQGRLEGIKLKDTGKDAIKSIKKWGKYVRGILEELFGANAKMPPFINETDSIESLGIDRVATDVKGAIDGITEGITGGNDSQEEEKQ